MASGTLWLRTMTRGPTGGRACARWRRGPTGRSPDDRADHDHRDGEATDEARQGAAAARVVHRGHAKDQQSGAGPRHDVGPPDQASRCGIRIVEVPAHPRAIIPSEPSVDQPDARLCGHRSGESILRGRRRSWAPHRALVGRGGARGCTSGPRHDRCTERCVCVGLSERVRRARRWRRSPAGGPTSPSSTGGCRAPRPWARPASRSMPRW